MLAWERLTDVLDYYPDQGIFKWKKDMPSRGRINVRAGAIAGCLNAQGYWHIRIDGRLYWRSRLAWFWMKGEWPEKIVDHADTNRTNDRWKNLRLATPSQNGANAKPKGRHWLKGVFFQDGWHARISLNRKAIYLGTFPTEDEAHAAYVAAALKLFGEFARAS